MSERIPILRVRNAVLVSIQGDLHDRLALNLQDDLLQEIARRPPRGVIVDISGLDVVDSFVGRIFGNLAAMAKLLGARMVLVGMRPAVAITLVELGVSLDAVQTALNVDAGLDLLSLAEGDPHR